MRLRSVSISRYKNLRDFTLEFDGEEFIDIFVGKNGSGKSNFLEALIEIFDHLFTFGAGNPGPGFGYTIGWDIDGVSTNLTWRDGELSINGKPRKQLGQTPLPANVIVYYSGQNDTVSELIRRYRDSYRRKVRNSNVADIPRFIGIGPDYKTMLLALMLMMPEETRARKFLCEKLGIEGVGGTTWLKLRRPTKGIVHQSRDHDPIDPEQRFWGVKGMALNFLDQLTECIVDGFAPGELYNRDADTYRLDINVDQFREKFAGTPPDEVFCQFNALRALGMIEDVSIPVRLGDAVQVTSRAFSDGQFQSIYLFAISELFKNRECVTLLDEPDAFLHPEWQNQFLSQVIKISDEAANSNHILMSSHSASTIAANADARLRVFEISEQKVLPVSRDKSEIIESLSAGLISFSEQTAQLSIHQVLKNTTGPIVFTEGVTDQIILETAWHKLYPQRDCPFQIQGTFGHSFLGALLREESIYREHPNRCFFAVFDFDEAFNNWNSNNTDLVQTDVSRGLTRKKHGFTGFFLLLPVPANLSVRGQAVNPKTGENFAARSALPIELLFHDVPELVDEFCSDEGRPGHMRKLKGRKTKFAEKVVPGLAEEHFECFRPLFETIEVEIEREA